MAYLGRFEFIGLQVQRFGDVALPRAHAGRAAVDQHITAEETATSSRGPFNIREADTLHGGG